MKCDDCGGTGQVWSNSVGGCRKCNGTGKVEPIKEVCEYTSMSKHPPTGKTLYSGNCGISYVMLGRDSNFCTRCGKPIKIKGE